MKTIRFTSVATRWAATGRGAGLPGGQQPARLVGGGECFRWSCVHIDAPRMGLHCYILTPSPPHPGVQSVHGAGPRQLSCAVSRCSGAGLRPRVLVRAVCARCLLQGRPCFPLSPSLPPSLPPLSLPPFLPPLSLPPSLPPSLSLSLSLMEHIYTCITPHILSSCPALGSLSAPQSHDLCPTSRPRESTEQT